jgi:hypothetical protein
MIELLDDVSKLQSNLEKKENRKGGHQYFKLVG